MVALNLEGAPNARDLGGIETRLGTIKKGKLIRSGELSRLTDNDVKILKSVPLARILDLRTETEKQLSPDYPFENVLFEDVSIIRATTFGITYERSSGQEIAEKLKAGFLRMQQRNETHSEHMEILYKNFVEDEHCRNGYGDFLNKLAHPVCGATLWHCTMGKDRVGTCTALLLHCLGATEQQIFEDYLLTNDLTAQNRKQILEKIKNYVSDDSLAAVEKMLCVNASFLQNFYKGIAEKYQTVDNFLQSCGVTQETVCRLQELYLD